MVDMKIRKALVLGSFLFCASFCIGAPVANTFLPVVPVPAEYELLYGTESEVMAPLQTRILKKHK